MSIVRNFNLYLNAGNGSAPYINVNQYDQGEQWVFTLYKEDGTKYTPSTGAIVGIKADNRSIINTGTVDSEGRVVINETQQMTASAGRAIYELSIDGLTHGTANFIVAVERKPTDDAVMSDSDLSLIQEAIDSAEVIVEVIGDSDPSEVIGEHVDDWLDNHPEATTTVQDGAITAPKINQSLWDKLLVSEEASGNPASFEDGADDVPVSSLKVALEPVQLGSGDPSPTNIRPIYPANGVNQFHPTTGIRADGTYNGITFTKNDNGSFSFSGTATAGTWIDIGDVTLEADTWTCSVKREGTYTGNVSFGANSGAFATYPALSTYPRTVASTESTTGRLGLNFPTGAVVDMTIWVQIERGSSVSSYQPYQGIMVERCGINQWDEQWENGEFNTNTGVPTSSSTRIRSKNFIPIQPSYEYYAFANTNAAMYLFFYDANQNYLGFHSDSIRNRAFVPSQLANDLSGGGSFANAKYMKFRFDSTPYNNDISINYPSTITDYHAYAGTSYPYSLGRAVYGGSVDLATGVLTITHFAVALKDVTWAKGTATEYSFTGTGSVLNRMPSMASATLASQMLSSNYPLTNSTAISGYETGLAPAAYDRKLYLRDIRYTTVSDLVSALTSENAMVVFPLTTPQTINLTPQEVKTLLGYNNISSSGTVEVIYHADTKLYVDKMTAVDNNIIAPTEETFTATRNYTVNDLVIVNDTLYKVTANIASGSAITPNSNVTATTLGALIKALS